MEIVNPGKVGDFHIHSATFSDGFNSIDEIVIAAGQLDYQQIAITDHSQALLDAYGMTRKTHYDIISSGRWSNLHNDVKVIFGVEADLLTEKGDMCNHIQNIEPEFVILSAHRKVYSGDLNDIKLAYLNAIKKFSNRIDILGHLCHKRITKFLSNNDIIEIVEYANESDIAMEINCANFVYRKTDLQKLRTMLDYAERVYVNSDAHTMNEFINIRAKVFDYLKN